MIKITKSQLINLYDLRDESQMSEPIKPLLKDHFDKNDDYIYNLQDNEFEHLIRNFNQLQKTLLIHLRLIKPEPKFKDGDYIIHRNGNFMQIIYRLSGFDTLYYDKKTFNYLFSIGSDDYTQSRLATAEEIKANTLIKLEVGSYIVDPFGKIMQIVSIDPRGCVVAKEKEGWNTMFWISSNFHRKAKLATPEQIFTFNSPWNEGIEEARKYKDGQPCLVRANNLQTFELRYADGKGEFYSVGRKSGSTNTWDHHMPLNETTIKNLPVNEK